MQHHSVRDFSAGQAFNDATPVKGVEWSNGIMGPGMTANIAEQSGFNVSCTVCNGWLVRNHEPHIRQSSGASREIMNRTLGSHLI